MSLAMHSARGAPPSEPPQRGFRLRWFLCGLIVLLVVALLPCSHLAHAMVALPEQRLTYPNAYQLSNPFVASYQGLPELSAAGAHVVGVWVENEAAPGIILGAAHVNLESRMWVSNQLALAPPYVNLLGPHAVVVDSAGRAGIINSVALHLYCSTPNLASVEFDPAHEISPQVPGIEPVLRSIASCPVTGRLYATFTGVSGDYPILSHTIRLIRSADGGVIWEPPVVLSSPDSDASTVVVGPDGEVYVSWVDYQQGRLVCRKSTDHGVTFSPEVSIASPTENFGARPKGWERAFIEHSNPHYTLGSFFYSPNFPRLAVDRGSGPTRGRLHAVWAERATGTVAPVSQQISEIEDNNSLSTAHVLAMNTEVWGVLPGYEDTGQTDFDIFAFDGEAGQTVYLYGEVFGDGYSPFSYPTWAWVLYGTRANGAVEGIYRGPMVRTSQGGGQPSYITLPRTGRYYLAVDQESRSFDYLLQVRSFATAPGSPSLDMRDIVIASSSDAGQTWSAPRRVNHGPGDSDQHMPNVAVDDLGRVYIAWYDRRGFELGDSVHAYAAVSTDGGLTFGADWKLSEVPSYWSGAFSIGGLGVFAGDRIAVAAGADFGVVAWSDFRGTYNGRPDVDVYAAWIVDIPVAVRDISDFAAEPVAEGVRLRWLVNDARAITGLRLFRAQDGGEEAALGTEELPVRAAGRGEFLDRTAEPGHAYRYRLRVARGSGADWLGPVELGVPSRIAALGWRDAQPNPFATGTSLRLAVPATAPGSVRVYDLQGKEVRTLKAGLFEAGEASISWDGRDARGEAVAPGVYFLDAHVGGSSVQMKLARVK